MKPKELVRKLESVGFQFHRHGGNHDIYRRGKDKETIPRHKEIDERLAKVILKDVYKRQAFIVFNIL